METLIGGASLLKPLHTVSCELQRYAACYRAWRARGGFDFRKRALIHIPLTSQNPVLASAAGVGLSAGRSVVKPRQLFVIAGTWLENSAQVEVNIPVSQAWDLWNDRERMPQWMPWISSVKVLKDQPNLSRWTLKYDAFGQSFEFSWIARNLEPIHHQKLHWRSVDGLPNRGAVRFYPRSTSSCGLKVLSPIVQNILQQDLERFAAYTKEHNVEV